MATSSDEQYRIQKAVMGNNGMSYQDAIDEMIDNGLDENSKKITLSFENNIKISGNMATCDRL